MIYAILGIAIVLEIVSLTALKETNGFTRLFPVLIFGGALAASFYFESLALKILPIGMTYTLWAGLGIVGMTLVGIAFYGEKFNINVVLGMALVIGGVTLIYNNGTPVAEAATEPVVTESVAPAH